MLVVRLVCWKQDLARERARILEDAGMAVDASPLVSPGGLVAHLRANPAALVLIDLDRLPSHGREVAVTVRNSRWTRHVPLVFAGGLEEKVARIRQELPDAFFTDWKKVVPALHKARKNAPAEPVQPTPHMERYAGSSLLKKLGFTPKTRAALLGPPEGFEETLGDLPDGAEVQDRMTSRTNLALWFVRSRHELEMDTDLTSARLPDGAAIWIIHPKKTGRHKVDFNQNDVRAAGLGAGLVDYKVCSVDADWSGLKFTRKKA